MRNNWKSYDPSWIVDAAVLVKDQYPWLESSLRECTKCYRSNNKYIIYFVDNSNPNEPGSEWQIETHIVLDKSLYGEIVLDILTSQRVGAVEFLGKLWNAK